MINFDFSQPTTQAAALQSAQRQKSFSFIAGGTNITDLMKRGVTAPEKLADINKLPLAAIEDISGGLRIGALARNSDVAEHAKIRSAFPLLAAAINAGASPQIRNMATTGGNLLQRTRCSYFYDTSMPCNKRDPGSGCSAIGGYNRMHAIFGASDQCIATHPSDMCVALAALDAKVQVASSSGTRTILFKDFHRLPGSTPQIDNELKAGELITAVDVPQNSFNRNFHYLKVRDRSSYAFALVSVAAAMQINNGLISEIRIAMGGVAHKPWRLSPAEAYLKGKPATEENFMRAAVLGFADAKSYGTNAFKLKMGPGAVTEALLIAAAKK